MSVLNDTFPTDSATLSPNNTVSRSNIEIMSSNPNKITTVAQLNILNQNNVEIIDINDVSTSSSTESDINALMSMQDIRERVTSYNTVGKIRNIDQNISSSVQ